MVSTSELQDVRAEIKELKKEVKDLKVQIAAADPTERLALWRAIASLQDRLATLQKKEERLDAQLSADAFPDLWPWLESLVRRREVKKTD